MTEAQKKLEQLFDEYVPVEGPADTLGGEIVRAVERVAYRWYNDGDMIYHGYGNITVTPSWRFVDSHVPGVTYPEYFEDDVYDRYIEELCKIVVEYLEGTPEVFKKENHKDSRTPTKEDYDAEREDLAEYDDYDD